MSIDNGGGGGGGGDASKQVLGRECFIWLPPNMKKNSSYIQPPLPLSVLAA
jgi:hypothetical protein